MPTRTVADAPAAASRASVDCNPDAGRVDAACAHLAHEHAAESVTESRVRGDRGYDLYFVEVDDQGALYPRAAAYGDTYAQLDQFIEGLRSTVERRRRETSGNGGVGDERRADRTGVGHYAPQVTHRVWPNAQACPGQAPLPDALAFQAAPK